MLFILLYKHIICTFSSCNISKSALPNMYARCPRARRAWWPVGTYVCTYQAMHQLVIVDILILHTYIDIIQILLIENRYF